MKTLAKLALGALMLTGAATAVSQPAQAAHIGIGIGIGVGPAYYGHPRVCDPYSRYYDPYYCGYTYDGPVFIDGIWVRGPLRWRTWGGHRQFFYHGGWRVGSGFHNGGFHGPRVSNHGSFSGGHGFGGHPHVSSGHGSFGGGHGSFGGGHGFGGGHHH